MPFDIGAGILLGIALSPFRDAGTNAALGALFVLLPDVDMLIFYASKLTGWGRLPANCTITASCSTIPSPTYV